MQLCGQYTGSLIFLREVFVVIIEGDNVCEHAQHTVGAKEMFAGLESKASVFGQTTSVP